MDFTPLSNLSQPGPPESTAQRRRILVWDAPTRVFHWLLALCFAGAFLTAESDGLRLVHVTLGYTMGALVVFRLVWGLVGSRYARFSNFMHGPRAVLGYLRSLTSGQPQHHLGHNPAGALAIVALLGLTVLVVATGWMHYAHIGGAWTEEVHEGLANAMLALVLVHVAAVLASSWLHRENLIGAMLHGHKTGAPDQGIGRPWRGVAAVLLVAVLGFWWWQGQTAPASDTPPAAAHGHEARHDD